MKKERMRHYPYKFLSNSVCPDFLCEQQWDSSSHRKESKDTGNFSDENERKAVGRNHAHLLLWIKRNFKNNVNKKYVLFAYSGDIGISLVSPLALTLWSHLLS
jgi:hypothetical protein